MTALPAILFGVVLLANAFAQVSPGTLSVVYPLDGSVFPPEFPAPTVLWRDGSAATTWTIEVRFASGAAVRADSRGDPEPAGEIDPRCVAQNSRPPAADPSLHAWKPDGPFWEAVKRDSVDRPAVIVISGFRDSDRTRPLSRGEVRITTSHDPVGAPIFYRDVPLMPARNDQGTVSPLPSAAIPLVGWRLRDVGESRSRLLLEGLPTCANCHSFSRDGKTLGIDVDGPENDKGTYALAGIAPRTVIRTEDVMTWNDFADKPAGHRTLGFMSHVSPDGRYAVSTVNESVYVANFTDYRFLQVFYPTRGILAWYDRAAGKIRALPGADDPTYVHTNAVWTPDGGSLVFARAAARDPYPPGSKIATHANDPNEVHIRYDLYRIPFRGGNGGSATPVKGASANGMSNSFPKVSPDGHWIVFVKARNGQLMRPDSRLYIVPFQGGVAREMRCNTPLMNSWHSFSPNGRWLVFSSKSRSPYTQMFLTHLDENGNDTPAILIENSTAANRAVNIPEFVNVTARDFQALDVPAADFYRVFERAFGLQRQNRLADAAAEWSKALALEPGDAKSHSNLAVTLTRLGRTREAEEHLRAAIRIRPTFAQAHYNLGGVLAGAGRIDEAVTEIRRSLDLAPGTAAAHRELGKLLLEQGKLDAALEQFERSLALEGQSPESHHSLAVALVRKGRTDAAIPYFREAIRLHSGYAEAHFGLGRVWYARKDVRAALAQWRTGLAASPDSVPLLVHLAWVLAADPDTTVRNVSQSIEFAGRAVILTQRRSWEALDALAAGYASAGRYRDAAAAAREAAALLQGTTRSRASDAVAARLRLYESGKAYAGPQLP